MPDTSNEKPNDIALAMVATSTQRLPSAPAIVSAALQDPSVPKPGFFKSLFRSAKAVTPAPSFENDNLLFPAYGGQIIVALMPAPIPWSELEGPCATAWWWKDAAAILRAHKFHFLVTLMGGTLDPVSRRVVVTRIVREILKSTDALGVYWGEGTLVHQPSIFLDSSTSISASSIPGPLWIDVRIEPNGDGTFRCFTTGLEPLGFMEIEVLKSTLSPDQLLGFVGDISCYIVNGRVQIRDGHTVGRTATEKYKVQYRPSLFNRDAVMQIQLP